MDSFYIIDPCQDGWTEYTYYSSHSTFMGNIFTNKLQNKGKLVCVTKFEYLFVLNSKILGVLALENCLSCYKIYYQNVKT